MDDEALACIESVLADRVGAQSGDLAARDFRLSVRACGLMRGSLLADLGAMLGASSGECLDQALSDDEVADIFAGAYLREGPLQDLTDLGDAALELHPQCGG